MEEEHMDGPGTGGWAGWGFEPFRALGDLEGAARDEGRDLALLET
jgi:hypothetical protein